MDGWRGRCRVTRHRSCGARPRQYAGFPPNRRVRSPGRRATTSAAVGAGWPRAAPDRHLRPSPAVSNPPKCQEPDTFEGVTPARLSERGRLANCAVSQTNQPGRPPSARHLVDIPHTDLCRGSGLARTGAPDRVGDAGRPVDAAACALPPSRDLSTHSSRRQSGAGTTAAADAVRRGGVRTRAVVAVQAHHSRLACPLRLRIRQAANAAATHVWRQRARGLGAD